MDKETVDLELNPGSKTFNSKYYPVPRINKDTFYKDLKCIVKIGLSTLVQHSKYVYPVFNNPDKEGTVRFIMEYIKLNQKLVIKPYPSPRNIKTMQNLEGFQYATRLYINMGYYTISRGRTDKTRN